MSQNPRLLDQQNRRDFLKKAAFVSAAGIIGGCDKKSDDLERETYLTSLGLGLFTIPFLLEHDFRGTLKMLSKIGYRELEFFGPYEFSTQEAKDYWAPIASQLGMEKSGYFGFSPTEIRAIMDRYDLSSPSMHTDIGTLESNMDALVESCLIVGHKYAGIAAIPAEMRGSLDDYKRMADRFNEIGRKLSEHGLKFLYHNHGYGLAEIDGDIPFNVLVERTDPDLVALELDVYWFTAGRADVISYLDSYPGRFKLMHIKDMSELVYFSGDGGRLKNGWNCFRKWQTLVTEC